MTTWELAPTFLLRHAGMPFDWVEQLGADSGLLHAVDAMLDGASSATGEVDSEYRAARARAASRLQALARREDTSEATFWSNPRMYANMWRPFAEADELPDNARWRRAERQVYTYLLRFCGKNETTSFFGPQAYGSVVPGTGFRPLRDRAARRRVFIAYWAVTELARAMTADRALLPFLPLRRTGRPGRPATGEAAAVLRAVDEGHATLADVGAKAGLRLGAVLAQTRDLRKDGVLQFGILPGGDQRDPWAELRREAGRLPDTGPVREWRGRLDRVEKLRADLEAAPFTGRRRLLPELERAFTAITGTSASRGAGEMYADRSIVFEECASRFALEVGDGTWRELGRQLSAALELSAAYGDEVQRAHQRELAGLGLERGDLSDLLSAAAERGIESLAAGQLPPVEAGTLASRRPGARYALLDVCLSRAAVDGTGSGDAEPVLARVHHHLQLAGWTSAFCPNEDRFAGPATEWIARGPGDGLLAAVVRRRNKGFYLFPGRQVVLRRPLAADAASPSVLWPQDITVRRRPDGDFELADPDGRLVRLYLPLADMAWYPPLAAFAHPLVLHAPLARSGDATRRSVGGTVYQRRQWEHRAPPPAPPGPRRFVRLRQMARELGLPRFVYVRTSDRKPYLIDTESTLGADLLQHITSGQTVIRIQEMLPGPDDLWMRDEQGRRYTCELRVQATCEEPS